MITKKEPVSSGTSGNDSEMGEVDRPALNTDSYKCSMRRRFLRVNDEVVTSRCRCLKAHPRIVIFLNADDNFAN